MFYIKTYIFTIYLFNFIFLLNSKTKFASTNYEHFNKITCFLHKIFLPKFVKANRMVIFTFNNFFLHLFIVSCVCVGYVYVYFSFLCVCHFVCVCVHVCVWLCVCMHVHVFVHVDASLFVCVNVACVWCVWEYIHVKAHMWRSENK